MDALAPLLFWSCSLAALAVPALIVVKLFINGASAKPCSWSVIFKAAVAFIGWLMVTVLLAIVWAIIGFSIFEEMASNPSAEWQMPLGLIVIDVVYLLVGGGLICWVWQEERITLA